MLNFGSEQEITTDDGRKFRLSKWKLKHLAAFRDWVAQRVGDPFQHLERLIDKMPMDVAREALRRAEDMRDQVRAFSLAGPLAQQHIATEEGLYTIASLLLDQYHPKASEEDRWAVAVVVARRFTEVLTKASGDAASPNAQSAPERAPERVELTGTRSSADCSQGQEDTDPARYTN